MIGNERYQCLAHLTNDAEQKTSQSGSFTVFSVAVNRKLKDKEITKFISCIKGGDNSKLLPYLKKGTYVLLEGSVDGNAYVSKEGIPKFSLQLNVFDLQLLNVAKTSNPQSDFAQPQNQSEEAKKVLSPEYVNGNNLYGGSDDLPF